MLVPRPQNDVPLPSHYSVQDEIRKSTGDKIAGATGGSLTAGDKTAGGAGTDVKLRAERKLGGRAEALTPQTAALAAHGRGSVPSRDREQVLARC